MSEPNPAIPGSQEAQEVLELAFHIMLSIIAAVLAIFVLLFSYCVVSYYEHPDDNDKTWWSKFVVVYSVWLVIYIPIFSALDFAAVHSGCESVPGSLHDDLSDFIAGKCGAPTKTILYILIGSGLIMNYWIIPFTLALRHNALSDPFSRRLWRALCQATAWCGLIIGLAMTLWYFVGYIEIQTDLMASGVVPYNQTRVTKQTNCSVGVTGLVRNEFGDLVAIADTPTCRSPQAASMITDLIDSRAGYSSSTVNVGYVSTRSKIFNYIQSIHTVMGWFVLSVLGGVGLAAMPWKLINGFIRRARRPMNRSEHIRACRSLSKRARELKENVAKAEADNDMPGWKKLLLKRQMTRALVLMEKEDAKINADYPQGFDPEMIWTQTVIGQWASLGYGLIGLAISCLWIAQITSYGIADPPIYLGLNRIFTLKDGMIFANIFSLVLLVIFTLHLNICCNQGLFSSSMFFRYLPVHPLTAGTTMIDQFLCQCQVGLYSAPALLAFQVTTLPLAASGSHTSWLFGFQFRYLYGWGFLLRSGFFMYLMMACFGLTVLIGGLKEIRRWIKAWKDKQTNEVNALTEEY